MANLLVLLELSQGSVLPVSLEALGQGRRIASALGATLYALVPLPEAPAYGDSDLIALAARHGADKVVLLTDEALSREAEMRAGTHGPVLAAACDQFPPTLLLMGATPGARDLAPRLAARLGAAYLPLGWAAAEEGRLRLRDAAGRVLELDTGEEGQLERAVVLTVPPGRYGAAHGDADAEMTIVAAPAAAGDFVQVAEGPGRAEVIGDSPEAEALRRALPEGDGEAPPALVFTVGEGLRVAACGGGGYALEPDGPEAVREVAALLHKEWQ